MAEFCKQCSISNFGYDAKDFDGLCLPGQFMNVLCEGCGIAVVDHTGKCVCVDCLEKHGKKKDGE